MAVQHLFYNPPDVLRHLLLQSDVSFLLKCNYTCQLSPNLFLSQSCMFCILINRVQYSSIWTCQMLSSGGRKSPKWGMPPIGFLLTSWLVVFVEWVGWYRNGVSWQCCKGVVRSFWQIAVFKHLTWSRWQRSVSVHANCFEIFDYPACAARRTPRHM